MIGDWGFGICSELIVDVVLVGLNAEAQRSQRVIDAFCLGLKRDEDLEWDFHGLEGEWDLDMALKRGVGFTPALKDEWKFDIGLEKDDY